MPFGTKKAIIRRSTAHALTGITAQVDNQPGNAPQLASFGGGDMGKSSTRVIEC
ncbi:MAG: hypothetical protein QGG36_04590 [Pirellulaceae bacterium]|jgi:hypothetical protein|nr:hypothetical protein [Pirellulaceae bacterium]